MRTILATALATFAVVCAAQESGTYDYEYMDFDGDLYYNIETGQPERITNGAQIVLYQDSSDEADRLRVRAVTISFTYPEGAEEPTAIVLDGNVIVEHPQGTIRAGYGEWNMANEMIVFTGSPKLSRADGSTLDGERVEYNLTTGAVQVKNAKARGFRLNNAGPKSPSSAALLKVDEVVDWPALLAGLKTEGASEAPSPGRQILQFIDPQIARLLPGMDASKVPPAENQSLIVKQLNRALSAPGLYNESAWDGKSVDPVVDLMLEKGTQQLSGDELVFMNRRLLEAAYPGAIAKFEAPTAP